MSTNGNKKILRTIFPEGKQFVGGHARYQLTKNFSIFLYFSRLLQQRKMDEIQATGTAGKAGRELGIIN